MQLFKVCEKCGGVDNVERHHWAPREAFSDADQWPTAVLCRDCHVRWHTEMRRIGPRPVGLCSCAPPRYAA